MSKIKNFIKKDQKLPLFGIGPSLILAISFITLTGIILTYNLFKTGNVHGTKALLLRIAGGLFIVCGFVVWLIGALGSDMNKNICENKLKTDGIYAWVRNPMYTGWWFLIFGISLMWANIFLLPLFFIDWLILTLVLKNTEEKWLLELYGESYTDYKKRVNRCIPFFPGKKQNTKKKAF